MERGKLFIPTFNGSFIMNIKNELPFIDDDQGREIKSLILDFSTVIADSKRNVCDIVRASMGVAMVEGWPAREAIAAAISSMRFVYDKFVYRRPDGENNALKGLAYIAYSLNTVGKEGCLPAYMD